MSIEDPKVVYAKIADGAVTTAKISDCHDHEFLALCDQFSRNATRMLELQEDYFARRPLLLFARWLGILSDPYMPARIWALRESGMVNDPVVAAEIARIENP